MKKLLTASALLTSLFMGCQQTDPFSTSQNTPAQKSLVELFSTDRNFSRLVQAVTRANVGAALSGGNVTVFAPDNAAFAAAGLDSAAISQLAPATLAAVLSYHVLNTPVRSTDLKNEVNQSVATLGGTAYVTKYDVGKPVVAINGARVTLADIAATNGVVHVIDNVLMPPTGTIADVVNTNPNFTFLRAALTRANLTSALSGAGPLTVFAPTNDAFISTTSYKTLEQINAAAPADLAAILSYHVTAGRVFTTNFVPTAYPVTGGTVVSADPTKDGLTTLAGGRVAVNGDLKVVGLGNFTKDDKGNKVYDVANITRANMLTGNGVVHIIDRVLLPQ